MAPCPAPAWQCRWRDAHGNMTIVNHNNEVGGEVSTMWQWQWWMKTTKMRRWRWVQCNDDTTILPFINTTTTTWPPKTTMMQCPWQMPQCNDNDVTTKDNNDDNDVATTNNETMKTIRAISHANGDDNIYHHNSSLLHKSPIHPPVITTHHPFQCTGSHTQPVMTCHLYYYINIYYSVRWV